MTAVTAAFNPTTEGAYPYPGVKYTCSTGTYGTIAELAYTVAHKSSMKVKKYSLSGTVDGKPLSLANHTWSVDGVEGQLFELVDLESAVFEGLELSLDGAVVVAKPVENVEVVEEVGEDVEIDDDVPFSMFDEPEGEGAY